MAMTNKIWIRLFVAIPGITPSSPRSHPIIQITATNHSKLFIIIRFFSYELNILKNKIIMLFKTDMSQHLIE